MSKNKLCDTGRCHAACCYNVPMEKGYLSAYRKKIVTPVIEMLPFRQMEDYDKLKVNGHRPQYVVYTDKDLDKNKCPFLRDDCKCNIYDQRPNICRMYGVTPDEPALRCRYICGKDADLSDRAYMEGIIRHRARMMKRGIKFPDKL